MTNSSNSYQISRTKRFESHSPEETFEIAERFGAELSPGDAVLLSGDLGAGKTLFTKGILSALDFDIDEVNSPSFTLVNLYRCENLDVYHIDLWRLSDQDDNARAVGLDEMVEQENSIIIIEWAEKLLNFKFPGRIIEVQISGDGDEPRSITINET